jgi:hypothetical protein
MLLKSNDPNQICTLFDKDVKCFKVENPSVPSETIIQNNTTGQYSIFKRLSDNLIIYKVIKGDIPTPNTPLCISSVEQDSQSSLHTLCYSTNPKMLDMIMLSTNYNVETIIANIRNNLTFVTLKQLNDGFVFINSDILSESQQHYVLNTYHAYYNANCKTPVVITPPPAAPVSTT